MADFTQIIQEINADITTNGVGAITGAKLNEVLRDMIAAVNVEKQDPLTIDATPTEDSTNPVQSGGVYEALEHKPTIYHITNIQAIPPTIISILRAGDILRGGGEYDSIAVVCKIDNNDIYFVSTDGDTVETFLYRNGVFYDYFAYQLSELANKVPGATQGDLAGLDSDGNLTDSGIAASDVAMNSDVVHNTGAEMVAGRKTFSDGIIVALDNNIRFNTDSQGYGVDVFASEDLDTVKRLSLADMEHEEDCRLGGIATPDVSNDAANKGYVDDQVSAKYSKPSGGIPKTDLASGVQTSLGKADTAFQKPSGGIPASDLATAVQNSLGKADTALQSYTETDPVFSASPAAGITSGDIADWDDKADNIPVVDASTIPASMDADKVYKYGTLNGNTTFPALNTPTDLTVAHVYCWMFTTPATAPTITWPVAITSWAGGSAPTINASKSYEVNVMDGFATIIEN